MVREMELDIVLGRLHPRERLMEAALAKRFGASRPVARDALVELERRGLVVRTPNVGATVVDLTPSEVRDIYDVRTLLELAAIDQIPMPAPADAIEALEAIQSEHEAAARAMDLRTVFIANIRFHTQLFGLCGNLCLVETIEELARRSYPVRSYSYGEPTQLQAAVDAHWAMIRSLAESDRDRLRAQSRDHLAPSRDAYIAAYRRRFPDEEV